MHIALTSHIIVPIFPRANLLVIFSFFISFFLFLNKCNPRTNFVTQSNLWARCLTTTRLPAEQTLSVDEQTRV